MQKEEVNLSQRELFGESAHSGSEYIQSLHRPCAAGEFVGLDALPLEHRYKEVWQRVVICPIEGEVLTVFPSAAG